MTTIEFLENRIAKAEASALKTFEDKNNEVMTLKKSLKSSDIEMNTLKNEMKAKCKLVKDKEKELHNHDLKLHNLNQSFKKVKEENQILKTENKRHLKKLQQKAEKMTTNNLPFKGATPSTHSFPEAAATSSSSTSKVQTSPQTSPGKTETTLDQSELLISMVSHWFPHILTSSNCSTSNSSMIAHFVVKENTEEEYKEDFYELLFEFQKQLKNDLVGMLAKL